MSLAQERYDRRGIDFLDEVRAAVWDHRHATTDRMRFDAALTLLEVCQRDWKQWHHFVPDNDQGAVRAVLRTLPERLQPAMNREAVL